MKRAIVVLAVLAVLGTIGWLWFQNMMSAPLYRPGSLAADPSLEVPLVALDDSTWQVDEGITLHHFERGEGPAVLVVHGGPGFPFESAPAGMAALEGEYRFHYYDQRGCGRSSRPIESFEGRNRWKHIQKLEGTLGIAAQLRDIERIRRALGDERIRIIGHSFGGFLAALYAAEFPDHVEALCLVGPADVLVMPAADGSLFGAVRGKLREERHADFDAFVERYLDLGSIFDKSEKDLLELDGEFTRYYIEASGGNPDDAPPGAGGWMSRALYFSMGRKHDYRPAMAAVTAPVLVIHGSEDLQPVSASQNYVDVFANARLETMEGCGHFPFAEAPERFAELIGEFFGAGR